MAKGGGGIEAYSTFAIFGAIICLTLLSFAGGAFIAYVTDDKKKK